MGREVGRGFRMGNTCTPMADSCECMAKPPQYCKVISLQLKLINFKKKKKKERNVDREQTYGHGETGGEGEMYGTDFWTL